MNTLTDKYQAHPIDAVQVTYDNVEEVAKWCKGKVTLKVVDRDTDTPFVRLEFQNVNPKFKGNPARNTAPILEANATDWVIREASGKFRVFRDNVFQYIFSPVEIQDEAPFQEGEGLFE